MLSEKVYDEVTEWQGQRFEKRCKISKVAWQHLVYFNSRFDSDLRLFISKATHGSEA